MARELKCDSYFLLREDSLTAPDLSDMPRLLTAQAYLTANVAYAQRSITEQMASIGDFAREFDAKELKQEGSVESDISDRLSLLSRRNARIGLEVQERQEAVGAMVQMVYATLQQRDNDLNRRYAADMRVITAITLVFLPGTFVATLFSASFWNFDPRSEGSIVSGWVWLYFFVTFALTLVVLGVWRGYTVLKQTIRVWKMVWRTRMGCGWMGRRREDGVERGKKDG
jgi:Mg2+ and Co2+ transporter CorA